MAEPITDAHVVGVLKAVVRGSGPVLDALTTTDPLGLKKRTHNRPAGAAQQDAGLRQRAVRSVVNAFYNTEYPGTAAWERMSVDERSDWWVNRIGRFTTLIVSIPGVGGVVADRFPVQDTLGAASQAMVLCAVARVRGLTDEVDQVRLLAAVLSRRAVSRELVEGTRERTDVEEPAGQDGSAIVGAGKAVWRYGRVLRGIIGELDRRPQGGFVTGLIGKLPVVGIAGDYLSERSGLKKAVRQAEEWIRRNGTVKSLR